MLSFSTTTANAMLTALRDYIDAGTGAGRLVVYAGQDSNGNYFIPHDADQTVIMNTATLPGTPNGNIELASFDFSDPCATITNRTLTFSIPIPTQTYTIIELYYRFDVPRFFRVLDSDDNVALQGFIGLHGTYADMIVNTDFTLGLYTSVEDYTILQASISLFEMDQVFPDQQYYDSNWTDVVLLYGFNGTDNSTTIIDESSFGPNTITRGGQTKHDTERQKFGLSSGYFDGSGDYLLVSDRPTQFNLGTDPFTIEAWIMIKSGSDCPILSNVNNWNFTYTANALTMTIENGSYVLSAPWFPLVHNWYHVAVDRDSSHTVRIYIDGVMVASSIINSAYALPNGALYTGTTNGTLLPYNGWMDELRLTKGVARCGSDSGFDLQSLPFPRQ